MAQALGITRKSIYRTSRLEAKDSVVRDEIIKAHKKHLSYGHRRLGWHLKMNPKRICRIMKKYGLRPPRRKGKPHYCTRSARHRKYSNLVKDLEITYENQVWCSDTNGFRFQGNKWYLVTIFHHTSRQRSPIPSLRLPSKRRTSCYNRR